MRYPSAAKSWFSGPSFFLPFSTLVKRGPCTVVTSNVLTASEKVKTTAQHSVGGAAFKQWNPQACSAASCGNHHPAATPSPLGRTCRTGGPLQIASNHALRGIWWRKTPWKTCVIKTKIKCSLKQAGANSQLWGQLANHGAAWRRKTRDGESHSRQSGNNRMKTDENKDMKNWISHVPLPLHPVTTAHAYSITGWVFKPTFAIVIKHKWQSPDSRRIPCWDTSRSRRRRICGV